MVKILLSNHGHSIFLWFLQHLLLPLLVKRLLLVIEFDPYRYNDWSLETVMRTLFYTISINYEPSTVTLPIWREKVYENGVQNY